MKKSLLKSWWLILFLAAALRLLLIVSDHYLSPDGSHYAALAEALSEKGEYQSRGAHFPDSIQPPLYPLLASFFVPLSGAEQAARLVSLLAGVGLIALLMYWISRSAGGWPMAIFSGLLLALHPALAANSSQAATESLYFLLLAAAFYSGWRQISRPEWYHPLSTAFFLILAYLTRPEALIFMVLFLPLMVLSGSGWRQRLRQPALFLLILIPALYWYSGWAQTMLGYRTISPKIKFVRSHARVAGWLAPQIKDLPPGTREESIKFALAPDSAGLAAEAIFYKKFIPEPVQVSGSLFPALSRQISAALLSAFKKLLKPDFISPLYLALAAAGLYQLWRRRLLNRRLIFYLLWLSPGFFIFTLSHTEERFLLPFVILLTLPAGWMWQELRNRRMVMIILTLILAISLLPGWQTERREMKNKNYYYQAGLLIKELLPPGCTVCANKPQAVFWSGLKFKPLPFAPVDRLSLYFTRQKADYLLLESNDRLRRPYLPEDLAGVEQASRLIPEHIVRVEEQKFYLFRIVK